MAGVTLGFLKYVLGLDTLNFRKGATEADATLARMQKSFAAKGRELQNLGRSMSAFVSLPLAAIGAKSIQAAKEVQLASAQVKSALASMGPVAGRSFEQLAAQADKLQHTSLFDDDDIMKSVTANMLTFGNVAGESFDRAQQAAINLSARLGQDLQSSAIQVGKALNDPIKGVTALRRVGVQLTQQQQDQVKAMVAVGNVAGAQKIILGELEREFGGAAAAQRAATPDADLQLAWRNFTETVGAFAIKILPPLTNGLAALLNAFNALPAPMQTVVVAVAAIGAGIGPVLIIAGNLMTLFSKTAVLVRFAAGLTGIGVAEGAAATGATAAGIAIRAMLGPLALAATAVTGVYLAWKNWDKIKPIVQSTVTAVADRIRGNLYPQLDDLKRRLGSVGDEFHRLYDRVVGHSYIPDMVDEIGQHLARLDGLMVKPAQKATAATGEAFKQLKSDVDTLLDQIFPEIAQARQQLQDLETLRKGIVAGAGDEGTLVAAQSRLLGADEVGLDQGSLVPDSFDTSWIDDSIAKMPTLVDHTREWGQALGEIGKGALQVIVGDLSGLLDKSKSLKDVWRDLLGFAISALTSSNGPLGSLLAGKRASGGPVIGGSPYLVGERGPEIFMPSTGGTILSNGDSRAAVGRGWGGAQVAMTVYANDADSFRRSDRQITRSLQRRLRG
jgi:hypothetical protein